MRKCVSDCTELMRKRHLICFGRPVRARRFGDYAYRWFHHRLISPRTSSAQELMIEHELFARQDGPDKVFDLLSPCIHWQLARLLIRAQCRLERFELIFIRSSAEGRKV